jgi:transposase
MTAYSVDLRARVLAACDEGAGTAEVAETFSVSPAWVRRLKQRRRERRLVPPGQRRHGPVPADVTHGDAIRAAVRDHPDATLREYREDHGLAAVSKSALARALARLGLSLKKSRSGRPSRTART